MAPEGLIIYYYFGVTGGEGYMKVEVKFVSNLAILISDCEVLYVM